MKDKGIWICEKCGNTASEIPDNAHLCGGVCCEVCGGMFEREQIKRVPAENLPEGWHWRIYDDLSGGLYSPENKSVVSVDFVTSEYQINGEWSFFSGYPYETISRDEFMKSTEKAIWDCRDCDSVSQYFSDPS